MFNLIPRQHRKKLEREYRLRVATILFGFLASGLFIAVVSIIPSYIISTTKINELQTRSDALKIQLGDSASTPLSGTLRDVKDLTTALTPTASSSTYSRVIENVVRARVAGITLDHIGVSLGEQGTVEISGSAKTREALVSFKQQLARVSDVQSVDSPISDLTKSSNIGFNIHIILKHHE